jgi:signal transduction histidine kinase
VCGRRDAVRALTTEHAGPGSAPALQGLLAILLSAVAIAAVAAWPTIVAEPRRFLAFAALHALASLCTFTASRRLAMDVSLGGAVIVVIALQFDPAATTTLVFISAFALREVQRRAPWRLALFNRAQAAVAGAGASLMARGWMATDVRNATVWMILAAVVTYFLLNGALTALAGIARGKMDMRTSLRQAFGPTWSTAICYVGALLLAAGLLRLGIGKGPTSVEVGLLLIGFASAAVGLRAATQAATARDELREALAHSLRSARDDRAAIGRYLHDEAMQSLSAASVLIASCRKEMGPLAPARLQEAESALLQSVASARDLLGRVVLPAVPEGLGAAITRELQVLEAFGTTTALRDELGVVADQEQAGVLFAAVREGLRNVRRHAEAEHVEVGLRRRAGCVEATVTDDGRGLEWSADPSNGGGHGIVLLRETLRSMGGTVTLADRRGGRGAQLEIRLPERRPVELAEPVRS